ncbi:MAG: hypothetical protein QM217_10685 [Bacillota bacterium]|jgi:hypothetical protein|nr:hypothetical protein [Bacillota bacterium]
MNKGRNSLLRFLVGLIMLVAGLYWFMTSVSVTTGFYSLRIGQLNGSGLVVVPFIVGICWLFVKPDSVVAKIIIVLGLVIILASIIAGTRFVFQRRTLYEYLLMLVFIFGGAAITLSMLLSEKDK